MCNVNRMHLPARKDHSLIGLFATTAIDITWANASERLGLLTIYVDGGDHVQSRPFVWRGSNLT